MYFKCVRLMIALMLVGQHAAAHDTWVETGANLVRQGEFVYVDLRLGNHGNQGRDFKLASKVTLANCSLQVRLPDSSIRDLKPKVIDVGSAEKEGYWSALFEPNMAGVHEVRHQFRMIKGRMNVIKNSKSYFISFEENLASINELPPKVAVEDELEIMLETPVGQLQKGRVLQVRVLLKGKPLQGNKLSIVPRGVPLAEGHDSTYDLVTGPDGTIHFTPPSANLYLLVAHHLAKDEKGEGYDSTHYGSTVVLSIPNIALTKSAAR